MAQLYDTQTQQAVDVPDSDVQGAIQSGRFLPQKGRIQLVNEAGERADVDAAEASQAFAAGWRYFSPSEVEEEKRAEKYEGRALEAGLAGAARGLTLGLSDALLTETGLVESETLRGLQDYNEGASTVGEVAGGVLPALLPGGQATLAGTAARLSASAAKKVGGGLIRRGLVAGAVEGGLYGAGSLVTEEALGRSEVTTQKALATVGIGILTGGVGGAIFGAVESKLSRKLLGEAGEEAAEAGEGRLASALAGADNVGDDAARGARDAATLPVSAPDAPNPAREFNATMADDAAAPAPPYAAPSVDRAPSPFNETQGPIPDFTPSGGRGGPAVAPEGVPPGSGGGSPPAGGAGGGGAGGGGGKPPGGPGDGFPDMEDAFNRAFSGAEGAAANLRKVAEETAQKEAGTIRNIFEAMGLDFPTPETWVLRGLDVKKKARQRLREKGLDVSAPRELLEDARFREASKSPEKVVDLLTTKKEEAGKIIGEAVKRFDALATPDDFFDPETFAARARRELVDPLLDGTVDEERAGRRIQREIDKMLRTARKQAVPDSPTVELPPPPEGKAMAKILRDQRKKLRADKLATDIAPLPANAKRVGNGVYEIPLSELDDIPAKPWDAGRLRNAEEKAAAGSIAPPIRVQQGKGMTRGLEDGNHRLAAARARGDKTIRVWFDNDAAAAVRVNRPRGDSPFDDAVAPMDLPTWRKPGSPPPARKMTFSEVEDFKRRLDRSLKWDATTPNEVRDQLRKLRGMLNGDQEARVSRLAARVGEDVVAPWKRAKQSFGRMAELEDIALERLRDAKDSNRNISLTDYLTGLTAFATGGGPSPVGLALGAGATLLNKWGRERLPFLLAIQLKNLEGNGAAQAAARAFRGFVQKADDAATRAAAAAGGAAPEALEKSHPFGPFAETLRRAAGMGERELWATHAALSSDETYREVMGRAGLDFRAEANATGEQRARTLSTIQQAAVDFDKRAATSADNFVGGKRSGKKPRKGPGEDTEKAAQAAVDLGSRPDEVTQRVTRALSRMGTQAPGTLAAAVDTAQRAVSHLAQTAPKPPPPPGGMDIPALRVAWKPTAQELSRFQRRLETVRDPVAVLDAMADGQVTREHVETLRAVYPDLYADMREKVLTRLASETRPVTYQQRLALGFIMGEAMHPSATPEAVAFYQKTFEEAQQQQPGRAPSASGPRISRRLSSEFSESDRLQNRRLTT